MKYKTKKPKLPHPPFKTENSSLKLIPEIFGFLSLKLKLKKPISGSESEY